MVWFFFGSQCLSFSHFTCFRMHFTQSPASLKASNATTAFLVSAVQISWNARLAFDLALRQLVQHIGAPVTQQRCSPGGRPYLT